MAEVTSVEGVGELVAELRALRVRRGLSQEWVGRAVGLPVSTVSRVEGNWYHSTVLVRHLIAYAEAMGCTLRFVLVADDSGGQPENLAPGWRALGLTWRGYRMSAAELTGSVPLDTPFRAAAWLAECVVQ
ncbi:helix-turn-helix domain-containing protein [Amycolatopsis sp. H20-H5]|uniref:helix-turn-helix domain-containing protein n=1 Tax=Amycolatopsis sp. H20-H5 TaxID=3046309 RepID=UPI002DBAE049|nr:helix-turn-helix transcriptional regulator [Amycolatopsis sp. H20-H5]MEC3979292.1 helix-turn-helix transcriptional regulator [Amycolatopsis sp. H20-H5]